MSFVHEAAVQAYMEVFCNPCTVAAPRCTKGLVAEVIGSTLQLSLMILVVDLRLDSSHLTLIGVQQELISFPACFLHTILPVPLGCGISAYHGQGGAGGSGA